MATKLVAPHVRVSIRVRDPDDRANAIEVSTGLACSLGETTEETVRRAVEHAEKQIGGALVASRRLNESAA